jgi:hypothetical protein
MQLREIDKSRYRKHYKILFGAIIAALILISLSGSALLIRFFSTPEQSHFIHNLLGVVSAALIVSYAVYRLRNHPFMAEVVYVWNLKQQLNRIYRKQRKIEPLIEENDPDAMVIMNYMYQGSKQLYELDDNTITMDDLAIRIAHLKSKMDETGLQVSTDQYDPDMLGRF